MKELNQVKDEIQQQAHAVWLHSGRAGTESLGTGAGKSRIAIMECQRMEKLHMLTDKDDILLVTPTEKLRDENWPDEFNRWGSANIFKKFVKPICFASLKNELGNHRRYKFIILDEILSILG